MRPPHTLNQLHWPMLQSSSLRTSDLRHNHIHSLLEHRLASQLQQLQVEEGGYGQAPGELHLSTGGGDNLLEQVQVLVLVQELHP